MRLVDVNGNPIGNQTKDPDSYAPEFVGSVFGLVNKISQKPEASFLFLSDSELIESLSKTQKSQDVLMSIIASYAAFTYAMKVKKMTQEEFQNINAAELKDELLARFDILPIGSVPFDALFELNPQMLEGVNLETSEKKEGE